MTDFLEVFDTNGHCGSLLWRDLPAFTQGYLEALFFTSTGPDNEAEGRGADKGFSDLAPEALAAVGADCAAFRARAHAPLAAAYTRHGYEDEQAGRDFWFTRNGHGVGFWDRELGPLGDKLSELARRAGTSDAYAGDDGRIYVS